MPFSFVDNNFHSLKMWRKFRKQTSRRVKEENKKRNTNEGRKKKDEETFNGVRGDKLYESKEKKNSFKRKLCIQQHTPTISIKRKTPTDKQIIFYEWKTRYYSISLLN